MALKDLVDQIDGFPGLFLRVAMRDLVGVKQEGEAVDGDGVHVSRCPFQ